jgi:hypothetical protein
MDFLLGGQKVHRRAPNPCPLARGVALAGEPILPLLSCPVAMRTAFQLPKLPTSLGLQDGFEHLGERFTGLLGAGHRLLCIALDDHLIVTDKYRQGSWARVPTLPQESQRQLNAVRCGSLDRSLLLQPQPTLKLHS